VFISLLKGTSLQKEDFPNVDMFVNLNYFGKQKVSLCRLICG